MTVKRTHRRHHRPPCRRIVIPWGPWADLPRGVWATADGRFRVLARTSGGGTRYVGTYGTIARAVKERDRAERRLLQRGRDDEREAG